ncbi:MAG: threonine/serine dehydratase [Candidatus Promineifilaceae bacterium]
MKEYSAAEVAELVREAEGRIRPIIRETLLEPSPFYSELTGANVYFKCENLQLTGSFKARGALNKILSLSEAERALGIVTASSGNHGAACAFSLKQVGAKGIVFVPEDASTAKVDAIRRLGAEVRHFGNDSGITEGHARQYAADHGMTYVPPYNDPNVMGGQGTIGLELTRQLDRVDAVIVAVGGGGLISGIAGYLKAVNPDVEVIGCTPDNSKVMYESIRAGEIVDIPSLPTLSDGTAGGIEPGSITYPVCRDLIDHFVAVSEEEISAEMKQFMGVHHMMIEGSAAVPIATLLKEKARFAGKNVVIVLCGANISLATLKAVL